ncbi:ACP S-malonyltransferase [Candidatus Schneideria nysicola]|uniref:ACP S-malonyltransferase n=1 Tax=Candidatus Schneideria nysicola TaxID=1081631 RepID=UPI001CAA697F|nr:ACP S-malonyltransferase [Candidatus Schneideria nysicola]UAJ65701.1 ACP S-malonyltransferase [Candidatus Schneideria nysicola]UAJ66228.1 ACP S-malonyltransferase [Candidatus Schneideria nysicola]
MNRFAMLFPGQGSQKIGMLSELAQKYSIIKSTFDEASLVLDYDLWNLVQHGPSEKLNQTCQSQPAILTASVAIWRLWKNFSKKNPDIIAGHSLGEYSALVCAEVLSFTDAIKLVALRGSLMQCAVSKNVGTMSAILGLDSKIIEKICRKLCYEQIVEIASYNAPEQTVISGHKEAVERVNIACKKAGAKRTIELPISVPSHCTLMKSISKELDTAMDGICFSSPTLPIINNVNVKILTHPDAIRQSLIQQLYRPVRWTEIIRYIANQGITFFIEVGPGQILKNLIPYILDNLSCETINNPINLKKMVKRFYFY